MMGGNIGSQKRKLQTKYSQQIVQFGYKVTKNIKRKEAKANHRE